MKYLMIIVMIGFVGCSLPRGTGAWHAPVPRGTAQYLDMLKTVPPSGLPRTFENGTLKTTTPDGWVSGFYPGTLLHLFYASGDTALLNEALEKMKLLEKEQYNRRTHDLGFMMFCSFGNANAILPGKNYDSILINSARSLSSRFSPVTGCIRSWDSNPEHFLVIIDNMMNLELLMYAFRQTGDSSFYKIAVTHANTTMKNHFREDYSSFHVVDYDPLTGKVNKRHTHQGANDTSAWARGQAWGLYGYTMMYRETGDERYLDHADHIAQFILNHPNLPKDKVPYWDFDAPGIPNALRDASAAAVMSSALLELGHYVKGDKSKTYLDAGEQMLKSLSEPPYKTKGMEAGGFLLQHSVGHYPNKSEIDVPLSYADYYYVEAMLKYTGKIPYQGMAHVNIKPSKASIDAGKILGRYKQFVLSQRDSFSLPGADGRWSDINYSGNNSGAWQLSQHMQRIKSMALNWADSSSDHFHSAALKASIDKALDDWYAHRYKSRNWWHNEIGIPQIMRDIMVLMNDGMDSTQRKNALEILGQFKVNGTGANLVWSADLGLHYGALTNNYPLMKACRDTILSVMKITTEEGVQPDYSFHQHGARLQMYHYGGAFLLENTRLAWQLAPTSMAYPKEKIDILAGFVLNGWQWMARGINTVPGTIDRAASRKHALHSADIRDYIPMMYDILPGSTAAFKEMLGIQEGKTSLKGYRYFPYSDFTSYHQAGYSFFLKTYSNRTLLTESINEENLKGPLLNAGDSYFIHDGTEYYDLMPSWDWSRLPGITNITTHGYGKPVAKNFVGNVGDNETGMAVMDYKISKNDSSLSAKKIWINQKNITLSLIAGLQTTANTKAFTVMDQSRWQGEASVNGKQYDEGVHSFQKATPVYHHNFMYIPLYNDSVVLSLKNTSARWYDINHSESKDDVQDKVFMAELYHRGDQSGYAVVYTEDANATNQKLTPQPWTILRNDTLAQATTINNIHYIALYSTNTITLGKQYSVKASMPCLLMIKNDTIYVSDPTHTGGSLQLNINKKSYQVILPPDGTTVTMN